MPQIPKTRSLLHPEWLDDPSVFDPLYKRVVRGVYNAAGMGEPTNGLPTPAAITGPMVAMIPPGIARTRGANMVAKAKLDKTFPQPVIEALEAAQQRWPRLFGHISKIMDVAPGEVEKRLGASAPDTLATIKAQQLYPDIEKRISGSRDENGIVKGGGKLSQMLINSKKHALYTKHTAANTIGHELLHAADRLTMPEFDEAYRFSRNLPGGYPIQSQEVRARLQGTRAEAYSRGAKRGQFEPATNSAGTRNYIQMLPKKKSMTDMAKELEEYIKMLERYNAR